MAFKQATAAQIREEIQRRIRESDALDGDCRESRAPTPRWSEEPNVMGSHWTFDVLPGRIPGCEEVVGSIVLDVMGEYELIQE